MMEIHWSNSVGNPSPKAKQVFHLQNKSSQLAQKVFYREKALFRS